MGTNISSNSDTRFIDGLEPDFLNQKNNFINMEKLNQSN